MIRDGKERGRGKWERCQEKIKEAVGGGILKEGVQVRVRGCAQKVLAGDQVKGRGWGMSAGTGYLQKGAGMGALSETTSMSAYVLRTVEEIT